MSFWQNIRKKFATGRFRKTFRNFRRNGRAVNLGQSRSVAILFRVDSEHKHSIVKNYVKHLKEEEGIRRVLAIGMVEAKELPEYLKPTVDFDYLTFKDVNFYHVPTGNTVRNFKDEEFDLLIDLERENVIPLKYLLNWGKAKMKVGFHVEENEPFYDLMMDVKTHDLVDYIGQLNYYLSILNKVS